MTAGASETAAAAQNAAETAALAAQSAVQAVPFYNWTGYFMGVALMFLMLGMLWFGARFLRQKGGMRFFGQTDALNVDSRLVLSPRKHLLVVRYRGKRLLLGVTEHNISLLSEDPLDEGETPGDPQAEAQSVAPGGKFKDILHDFNKRK